MPIYEYQCDRCGHRSEELQRLADPPVALCPNCGGPYRKLISAPSFQFKGSGWYVTDYARNQGGKDQGKSDTGKSEESSAKSEGGAKDSASKDSGSKDGGSKEGAGDGAAGKTASEPSGGDKAPAAKSAAKTGE